jgi:hypothetical protein
VGGTARRLVYTLAYKLLTKYYVFLRIVLQLLVTVNVVPSSPILAPDDGGLTFLRNVGSHKSHTV